MLITEKIEKIKKKKKVWDQLTIFLKLFNWKKAIFIFNLKFNLNLITEAISKPFS